MKMIAVKKNLCYTCKHDKFPHKECLRCCHDMACCWRTADKDAENICEACSYNHYSCECDRRRKGFRKSMYERIDLDEVTSEGKPPKKEMHKAVKILWLLAISCSPFIVIAATLLAAKFC